MTGLRSAGRVRQRASSPCETAAHLELKELLNDLASIRSRYDTLVTKHGHMCHTAPQVLLHLDVLDDVWLEDGVDRKQKWWTRYVYIAHPYHVEIACETLGPSNSVFVGVLFETPTPKLNRSTAAHRTGCSVDRLIA